jgi:hypothetical protein
MNLARSAILCIIVLQNCHSSSSATVLEQPDMLEQLDAAMVPLAVERELQDVQHDFTTLTQHCFIPLVLDQAGADQLAQEKILWDLLVRKAEARAIAAPAATTQIIAVLNKTVVALQYAFLQTQLLALGKKQSSYALMQKGLNKKEQQTMVLMVLQTMLAEANAIVCTLSSHRADNHANKDLSHDDAINTVLDPASEAFKKLIAKTYATICKNRFQRGDLFNGPFDWPNGIEFVVVGGGTSALFALYNNFMVADNHGTSGAKLVLLIGLLSSCLAKRNLIAMKDNLWDAARTRLFEIRNTQKVLAKDILAQQPAIIDAWLKALQAYHAYTSNPTRTADATTPGDNKMPIAQVLNTIDESIILVSNRINCTDAQSVTVIRCILANLNNMRTSLATASLATTLHTAALKEAYAKHCAILQSEGFADIVVKLPELAQRYQHLVELFFQNRAVNDWFSHQSKEVVQLLQSNVSTMRQNWYLLKLGRPESPSVDTMNQMVSVLEACEKQTTSFAWLKEHIPPGLKDNPVYKFLLSSVSSDLLAPAGGGAVSFFIINRIMAWLTGSTKTSPTSSHVKDLLTLEKEHPVIFNEIVKQHPEILEHLVQHFASRTLPTAPTGIAPAEGSSLDAQNPAAAQAAQQDVTTQTEKIVVTTGKTTSETAEA